MANLQKGGSIISGLLLVVFVVFIVGCTSSPVTTEPHNLYNFFDEDFGQIVSLSPSVIVPGKANTMRVKVLPRESGTGFFVLWGHETFGRVISPIEEELIDVDFRVEFERGSVQSIDWVIEFATGLELAGISLVARMDSVDIDGTRYPIRAPEVSARFGFGFGNSLFKRVVVTKEE